MKVLKEELDNRIDSVEENICIKYVEGVPKIVAVTTINSNL